MWPFLPEVFRSFRCCAPLAFTAYRALAWAIISFRASRAVALMATLAAAGVFFFRSSRALATSSIPSMVMVRLSLL